MQAIVLAGGFGTRLKSVISDIPKPMAPIKGKPFLEILLDRLVDAGFLKVVLAVGYKHEVIVNHFNYNYRGMEIEYVVENNPLGTGGACLYALNKVTSPYVFVLNGDTLFDIQFPMMVNEEDITIASKYLNNNDRYGHLEIKDGYISSFREKTENDSGYINGGIYRFSVDYLRRLNMPKNFSMEKDLLEKIVKKKPIKVFVSNGYFIDIGVPEDYDKFQRDYDDI